MHSSVRSLSQRTTGDMHTVSPCFGCSVCVFSKPTPFVRPKPLLKEEDLMLKDKINYDVVFRLCNPRIYLFLETDIPDSSYLNLIF
jgi:hypothetical protein